LRWYHAMGVLMVTGIGSPSNAQLLSSCALTLSVGGKLAMSGDGRTMGTEVPGGLGATLLMVGVNLVPEVFFTAQNVTGPTGWSATPTMSLAVSALSGAQQPYTSSNFAIRPGALIDTLTVHAKIDSPTGFKAGSYQASTQVTCQAA